MIYKFLVVNLCNKVDGALAGTDKPGLAAKPHNVNMPIEGDRGGRKDLEVRAGSGLTGGATANEMEQEPNEKGEDRQDKDGAHKGPSGRTALAILYKGVRSAFVVEAQTGFIDRECRTPGIRNRNKGLISRARRRPGDRRCIVTILCVYGYTETSRQHEGRQDCKMVFQTPPPWQPVQAQGLIRRDDPS